MLSNDTIAAIATPPGRGSIAVIRISGKDSFKIADCVFKPINKDKSISKLNGYTAAYGTFYDSSKDIDTGVALCFKSPHSYTGEDVVELSCHGGEVVCKTILRACFDAGASPASPGEFTKRALLNGKLSLNQAEAVMDIISAQSKQAAAAAHAVIDGKLNILLQQQKQKLINLVAHITACIDFPEEGVEELQIQEIIYTIDSVKTEIQNLIDSYEKTLMVKRGIKVVIAGSPNAGKSTLFNLLYGNERTIVTSVAGTTRDVITEEIDIDGIPLIISDTAGLHKTDDMIEAEGIKRSYGEIDQSGLIIAVFDGSMELKEEHNELIELCQDKISIAVINKSDKGTLISIDKIKDKFTKALIVSAKEEKTREILKNAIKDIVKINEINTDLPMLINERQLKSAIFARDSLQMAYEGLVDGITMDAAGVCVDDAIYALAEITGENVPESILDDLFSRFCVGK